METAIVEANETLLRRRAQEQAEHPKPREPRTGREVLEKIIRPSIEKTCQSCHKLFKIEFFIEHADLVTLCLDCQQTQIESQSQAHADRVRIQEAEELCPLEYRNTDINALPNPAAARLALRWEFGPKGLILHGITGRGKTRTAWLVMRNAFLAGKYVRAITSTDLSFHLPGLYVSGADAVDSWLKRLCEIDVLLLDDVFKAVLNERCEAFLFALLSGRNEKRKPCITTLNDTSESLAARLTQDRSAPLLRRLKDYATVINFG